MFEGAHEATCVVRSCVWRSCGICRAISYTIEENSTLNVANSQRVSIIQTKPPTRNALKESGQTSSRVGLRPCRHDQTPKRKKRAAELAWQQGRGLPVDGFAPFQAFVTGTGNWRAICAPFLWTLGVQRALRGLECGSLWLIAGIYMHN